MPTTDPPTEPATESAADPATEPLDATACGASVCRPSR